MFGRPCAFVFFFNDTATTEIYTLSLHDALPISRGFVKSVACNITGIIIAALSLLAIDLIGSSPIVAAVCVGIGSAAMVQASKLPFTHGITPAIVWGFSQTVGTVAVTGFPVTAALPNNPVLIAIAAMIIGAIFGYLSEAWGKAMTTSPA